MSGFDGAPGHVLEFERVGGSAQIPGASTFGERAEAAVVQTDVGVVDVAIDDVGHRIADRLVTQLIGRGNQRVQIAALGTEESNDIGFVERVPCRCRVDQRIGAHAVGAAWPALPILR